MKISDVLTPELTSCNLPGRSKKRILENIAQIITAQLGGNNELCDLLFDNFVSREKLGSTGLGNGVAIPHCRTPGVKKIYGFLAKLTSPVDFDAIDDEPVDLVFALVVPEEKNDEHLSTLARIAKIMQDEESRQKIRDCENDDLLFNTVLALERK
ncbi:MAG: PTS sugar transporter subunit IIA [Porticoccaceae bacterium]|nr:PTS sugar transporter subunit IIA [Porticoccaceae bacterium]